MAKNQTSVDITGLAKAWESSRGVRKLFMASGRVTQAEPGEKEPNDNVRGVGTNHVMLAPLMPMLWVDSEEEDGYGHVGMVSIPALETEFLSLCSNMLLFILLFIFQ